MRILNQTISCLTLTAMCFTPLATKAQITTNQDKFLGNITTWGQMDAGGGVPQYYKLWNQVTPENESKWGSVEGTRNSYNWGCDTPFNYAKNHNFTYKFHALIWGAQYPEKWFNYDLSITERYKAIENWYNQVKKKYNHLPMIDVVNEAVGTHQPGNPLMKESLGGGGKTGYDWLIKAFELAGERFPNSILIYNDYNTFQWDTDNYIKLVQNLRDAGAPIDAYGCQSHDLKGVSLNSLKTVDKKIQDALKMPMYITEYDIQEENDQKQLNDYKNHIPYFWERDYCAGVTLWGYVYGKTWNEGTSGIYKDGAERAAMTWLKEYMASDAAKNATDGQSDDAHCAINKTYLLRCQSQSALVNRVEHERRDKFHQLCFRQTIQQHEKNGYERMLFFKEQLECLKELTDDIGRRYVLYRVVRSRFGKHPTVINAHEKEECRENGKHHRPCKRNAA